MAERWIRACLVLLLVVLIKIRRKTSASPRETHFGASEPMQYCFKYKARCGADIPRMAKDVPQWQDHFRSRVS